MNAPLYYVISTLLLLLFTFLATGYQQSMRIYKITFRDWLPLGCSINRQSSNILVLIYDYKTNVKIAQFTSAEHKLNRTLYIHYTVFYKRNDRKGVQPRAVIFYRNNTRTRFPVPPFSDLISMSCCYKYLERQVSVYYNRLNIFDLVIDSHFKS